MPKKAISKKGLPPAQHVELLRTLEDRFEKNMNRHHGLEWAKVNARLEANPDKMWSLSEMENTGGEPDVVGHDKKSGEYIFYDCSEESPTGRRSLCYDRKALDSRKEHKPKNCAMDLAAAMGIELLTEEQYRDMQKLGNFDMKRQAGCKHLLRFETLAAPFFVIAAMALSSCITTAQNLTMPLGGSVARSGSKL